MLQKFLVNLLFICFLSNLRSLGQSKKPKKNSFNYPIIFIAIKIIFYYCIINFCKLIPSVTTSAYYLGIRNHKFPNQFHYRLKNTAFNLLLLLLLFNYFGLSFYRFMKCNILLLIYLSKSDLK